MKIFQPKVSNLVVEIPNITIRNGDTGQEAAT